MADIYAIIALRRKRAHLAGEIENAQKALLRKRGTLATLDAVILLFEPEGRPDVIPAIRPVSRTCLFFRRGELTRLCVAALRDAGKPTATRLVATYALAEKGLTVEAVVERQVIKHARNALLRLEGNGVVRKIVTWPDMWREVAKQS